MEYLELFEQVIKIYGKENKVERIGRLEDMFLTFLRAYDQKVREKVSVCIRITSKKKK